MQKEELLHLHMLMVQVKKYYESVSGNNVQTAEYDALQISPIHIHKNKNLHRVALLTLGNEIVSDMNATQAAQTPFTQEPSQSIVAEH
ncbi:MULTISPECIES: UPF0058 family protein [Methanocorpusculum]|jgi:hypothetical protein|uniref:UPF0058 family protein n=1 Tax=Methanocorpusculum TaxID=2192 RepID=UPI0009D6D887|nr:MULTISPECIES: UPF0058 family protein [Methanocorpusculum]MDD4423713.1 UPF0058 family protein [Methanocorpusculum parvum]MDD2248983.1 UPF0058 family protein [Methanocorpusculum sp.]MDD2803364.1 UPF0058 family protein [Methanocorpusculum sp.]MDD3046784.1 UPF0058 family protein [Methanocorpusculum sp.]MDD3912548.1 UPF0058 family protein [Methanocorpusculum sp.]